MHRHWPGIHPVPPVSPYLSPNHLPSPRFARAKDLGLQNQMRRVWNDRYVHGSVYDLNPLGPVWDLDPRPRQFESEFPPAPNDWSEFLEMLDEDEDEDRGSFSRYGEDAPKGLQKLKQAVFDIVRKKDAGAPSKVADLAAKAKQEVRQLVAPQQQPPIIIHTPAQEHQETAKTVAIGAAIAIAAFGAGWYAGSHFKTR